MEAGYWLAQQPLWLTGFLVIGGGMVASAIGVYLVYAFFTDQELASNIAVGSAKVQFLSQIYAVFLGLLLVGLYQQYLQDQKVVQQEAGALTTLGDLATLLAPADQERIHGAVRDYARAVVEDEWPRLGLGQRSSAAEERFRALTSAILASESTGERPSLALQSMISTLGEIRAERQERTATTPKPLNQMIWFLLLLSTAVSIAFFWFFGDADLSSRLLFSSMLTAVIMAEVLAILILSYPFTGEAGISSEPFLAIAQ